MTSQSHGLDVLLRAAQFLEDQEQSTQPYRVVVETPQLSTGEQTFALPCKRQPFSGPEKPLQSLQRSKCCARFAGLFPAREHVCV